jgi:hypothetical protein
MTRGIAFAEHEAAALAPHLTLAASFDLGLDADHAAGDPALYTAPSSARSERTPGLPGGNLVRLGKDEGKFGHALFFTQKMKPVVFFAGDKNIAFRSTDWQGTCSFWLKLDPDKDLAPGYCDPLQLVGQAWDEGHMFAEFSKDHEPRRFRFAIRPMKKLWNPDSLPWEDSPEKPRLMAEMIRPPFTRSGWTHVAFTFTGVNVPGALATGTLYVDGVKIGSFQREQLFNWDPSRSALAMGLSYVGGLDDLAFFDRVLTPAEIQWIQRSEKSVVDLFGKAPSK